jgi:SOS response regulatory protein OraA/RecX
MTTSTEEGRARVASMLSVTEPTTEKDLFRKLIEAGMESEEIVVTINECHMRNEIRWVAFQGWCLGGRPHG